MNWPTISSTKPLMGTFIVIAAASTVGIITIIMITAFVLPVNMPSTYNITTPFRATDRNSDNALLANAVEKSIVPLDQA